jgi:hypothetical protein
VRAQRGGRFKPFVDWLLGPGARSAGAAGSNASMDASSRRVQSNFRRFDADNSGSIELAELEAAVGGRATDIHSRGDWLSQQAAPLLQVACFAAEQKLGQQRGPTGRSSRSPGRFGGHTPITIGASGRFV